MSFFSWSAKILFKTKLLNGNGIHWPRKINLYAYICAGVFNSYQYRLSYQNVSSVFISLPTAISISPKSWNDIEEKAKMKCLMWNLLYLGWLGVKQQKRLYLRYIRPLVIHQMKADVCVLPGISHRLPLLRRGVPLPYRRYNIDVSIRTPLHTEAAS